MPTKEPAKGLFESWLRSGMSGCRFVVSLSHKPNTIRYVLVEGQPDSPRIRDTLTATLDDPAGRIPVVLFPDLDSERDIAELLVAMRSVDRWDVRILSTAPTGESYDVLVTWATATGHLSHTMGFAPLFTMPITRRAPLVALALWPGGHDNKHHEVPSSSPVTLADAANIYGKSEHRSMWKQSEGRTREILRDRWKASDIRQVTFALPASTYDILATKS